MASHAAIAEGRTPRYGSKVVRRVCLSVALAGLAALAASCESTPKLAAKGRLEVPVAEPGVRPVRVKAKFLDEVVIALPPVSQPGNQWMIVMNDGRWLQPRRAMVTAANGSATMAFLAIKPGRRPLRFAAVAPNVRESVPSDVYDLVIEIE